MSHEEQLNNPLYRNWVKAGVGLKYLKDGIENFIDNRVKDLQSAFLIDIATHLGRGFAFCDRCTIKNVSLRSAKCPNNVCGSLCQKIKDQHRYNNPSWKNTDSTLWCKSYWQIAKCYLPAAGYGDKTCASDTDCSGLLNIAINLLPMQTSLDELINPPLDIFSKNLNARNEILHSSMLQLTEETLNDYIDGMILLLQDKKVLASDADAKAAIENLTQLKHDKLVISTKDEFDIRKTALAAIEEKKNEAIEDIEAKKAKVIEEITCQHNEQNEALYQEVQLFSSRLDAIEYSHKRRIDYLGGKQRLQDTLITMYEKHISSIPVSPVLHTIDARVEDVFVELIICDDLVHEPNTLENKRTDGKKVEGYKDILFKANTRNTNIYIIGDAGIGKTTWCMKFLSTWVSSCEKSIGRKKNRTDDLEDISTLSEFYIVLFVSLRHATADGNILDMIKNQLFDEHPHLVNVAKEVLENEPHKCLIILDGLDEWSPPNSFKTCSTLQDHNLPGRKGLYGCTVVTTTRAWKLNLIRLKDEEIDRAVKIQGLEDQGLLARKIIDRLNAKLGHVEMKTYTDFQNDVQTNFLTGGAYVSNLPEFMKVPLILTFMVCLWFDDGKFERTLSSNYSGLLEFLINNAEGNTRSRKKRRLNHIQNLDSLKQIWSTEAQSVPECIRSNNSCKEYSHLILCLAHLAFDSLFAKEHQKSLVFTDASLKKFLSKEELDVALHIGIVSQTQVIGKALSHMAGVSFLHKTFHEFLASVHLVSSANGGDFGPVDQYVEYCCSYEDVKEMENVLVFVCGMCPQTASRMSKHIANLALKYRDDVLVIEQDEYVYLSKNLPLRCVQEVHANDQSYPSGEYPIYRDNWNLDVENICSDNAMCHLILFRTNVQHLTGLCVHVRHPQTCKKSSQDCDERRQLISNELHNIKQADKLTDLELHNAHDIFKNTACLPKDISSLTQLQKLVLCNITCTKTDTTVQNFKIDLSNCMNLKHFRSKNMSSCTFTLNPTNLEEINVLNNISCTLDIDPIKSCSHIGREAKLKYLICNETDNCCLQLSNMVLKMNQIQFEYCKSCSLTVNTNDQASQTFPTNDASSIDSIVCIRLTDCNFEFSMDVNVGSFFQKEDNATPGDVNIEWKNILYVRLREQLEESIDTYQRAHETIEIEQLSHSETDVESRIKLFLPSLQHVSNLRCLKCSNMSEMAFGALSENLPNIPELYILDMSKSCHNMTLNMINLISLTRIRNLKCSNIPEHAFDLFVHNLSILTKLELVELSSNSIDTQELVLTTTQHTCTKQLHLKLNNISEETVEAIPTSIPQLGILVLQDYRHNISRTVIENISALAYLRRLECINLAGSAFDSILSNIHVLTQLDCLELSGNYKRIESTETQTVCFDRTRELVSLVCSNISEKALESLVTNINHVTKLYKLELRKNCSAMNPSFIEQLPSLSCLRRLSCTELPEYVFYKIVLNIHTLSHLDCVELSSSCQSMGSTATQTISLDKSRHPDTLECSNISEKVLEILTTMSSTCIHQIELRKYCHDISPSVIEKLAALAGVKRLTCIELPENVFCAMTTNIHTLSQLGCLKLAGDYQNMGATETQEVSIDKGRYPATLVCSNISKRALEILITMSKTFIHKIKLLKYCHDISTSVIVKLAALAGLRRLTCIELPENVFCTMVSNIHTLSHLDCLKLSGDYQNMGAPETQTISIDKSRDPDTFTCSNISERALEILITMPNLFFHLVTLELRKCCHAMSPSKVQKLAVSTCLKRLRCMELSESDFYTMVANVNKLSELEYLELSGKYQDLDSANTQTITLDKNREVCTIVCSSISERTLAEVITICSLFMYDFKLKLCDYNHTVSLHMIQKLAALAGLRRLSCIEIPENVFYTILPIIRSLRHLNCLELSSKSESINSTETQAISLETGNGPDILVCSNISKRALEVLISMYNESRRHVKVKLRKYCHDISASMIENMAALAGLRNLKCTELPENAFYTMVSNVHILSQLDTLEFSSDYQNSGSNETQSISLDKNRDDCLVCENISEKALATLITNLTLFPKFKKLILRKYCHDIDPIMLERLAACTCLNKLSFTELPESVFYTLLLNIHTLSQLDCLHLSDDQTMSSFKTQTVEFDKNSYRGTLVCRNISGIMFEALVNNHNFVTQLHELELRNYGQPLSQTVIDKIPELSNLRILGCTELSESAFNSIVSNIHTMSRLTNLKLSGDYYTNCSTETQTISWCEVGVLECSNLSERTLGALASNPKLYKDVICFNLNKYNHNISQTAIDGIAALADLRILRCTELSESAFISIVSIFHKMTEIENLELSGNYYNMGSTETQTISWWKYFGKLKCSNLSERTLEALFTNRPLFDMKFSLTLHKYRHSMSQTVIDKLVALIGTTDITQLEGTDLSESAFNSIVSNIHKIPTLTNLELSGDYHTIGSTETQTIFWCDEDEDDEHALECSNLSETTLEALFTNRHLFNTQNKLTLEKYRHSMSQTMIDKLVAITSTTDITQLEGTELSESAFNSIASNIHKMPTLINLELSGDYYTMGSTETQTIVLCHDGYEDDDYELKCSNLSETTLEALFTNPHLFNTQNKLTLEKYRHSMSQTVIDKLVAIIDTTYITQLKGAELSESAFNSIVSNIHKMSKLKYIYMSSDYYTISSTETQTIFSSEDEEYGYRNHVDELNCSNLSERTLDTLVTNPHLFDMQFKLILQKYRHSMSQTLIDKLVAIICTTDITQLEGTELSESAFNSLVSNIHKMPTLTNLKLSGDYYTIGSTETQTIFWCDEDEDEDDEHALECSNISERTLEAIASNPKLFKTVFNFKLNKYSHNISQTAINGIAGLADIRILQCIELSESAFQSIVSNIHTLSQLEYMKISGNYYTLDSTEIQTISFRSHDDLRCRHVSKRAFELIVNELPNFKQLRKLKLQDFSYSISAAGTHNISNTDITRLICKNISDIALASIASTFLSLKQLETLELSDFSHNMSTEAIQHLSHAHIKHLTCNNISENAFEEIVSCIHCLLNLETFEISHIRSPTKLPILSLSITDAVSGDDINAFPLPVDSQRNINSTLMASMHAENPQSHLKYMKCTDLSEHAWNKLATQIESLTQLEKLELSDDKENAMIVFLRSVKCLHNLSTLCCHDLSKDALEALAATLPALKQLKVLELVHEVSRNIPHSLTQALHKSSSLVHLHVANLSDVAWDALSVALPSVIQLEILELSGLTGNPSVIRSLQFLKNLKDLRLYMLSNTAFAEIKETLPKLIQLEVLKVNFKSGGLTTDVIQGLQYLNKLKHLEWKLVRKEECESFITIIPNLAQLEVLAVDAERLYSSLFSCLVQSWQYLSNLKQLTFNGIHDNITEWRTLTQIEVLEFNKLWLWHDFPDLSGMRSLKKLTLCNSGIYVGKQFIDNLPDNPHEMEVNIKNVYMPLEVIKYIKASRRFPSQQWECKYLDNDIIKFSATLKTMATPQS